MATALNYATQYQQALDQAFPYVLNFGALYATPNNGRFRWINSKTIEVPTISTTGRTDSNRDTLGAKSRNYTNGWTPYTLTNERKWDTLVHPRDIDETNMVTSIGNITRVFNEEQKFPEMDAYCISKIYADYNALDAGLRHTVREIAITADNVLETFDTMMTAFTEARVPKFGLTMYVTPDVALAINTAKEISRTLDVGKANDRVRRAVKYLEEVEIVEVASELMKTVYDFTVGWTPDESAKQIEMFLVDPNAVITPVSYEFSQLDAPSAGSEGKWDYYEESHEDVFVLKNKAKAIQFVIEPTA